MKDINDLLSQFDDLQDLPVSEEMLGAYIEGNLDPLDEFRVNQLCDTDSSINDVISYAKADTSLEEDDFINDVELSVFDNLDIELPQIPVDEFEEIQVAADFSPEEDIAAIVDDPIDVSDVSSQDIPIEDIASSFFSTSDESNNSFSQEEITNTPSDDNDSPIFDDFSSGE